jgi:dTDP-glucose 4,6-dehydratase
MQTTIVTGAAGFLGSHLCAHLLEKGKAVLGIDNCVTGSLTNLEGFRGHDRFAYLHCDVSKGLPRLSQEIDRIYHLASPASPIDYYKLPLETMYVNSHGTQHLLELAHERGARFFFSSTSEVYGDPEVHPQHEEYWGNVNPIGPRSVYDEAKRYAEALIMSYKRSMGTDVRVVRIFNTYGPRMRADDGRVIPTFINQALNKQPLTIFGDGTQTRSFCYVDDLIRGFWTLMESDFDLPCNLGNPHELSMKELAEEINRKTKNPAGVVYRPLPKDDPTRRKPDLTRARTELGWEPRIQFAEGIEKTIDFFSQ